MAEEKKDKKLDVCFTELNAPTEEKEIAVKVLSHYINQYEKILA